uniref:PAN2-PAN3 deadenylation complex subunit PAN3 n=3 Tax=Lygus hesperus TaxID=30085 RepID=A0A0A9X0K3_LYGHE
MEHMYLPYTTSHVNGVPQESKLATYMKRQSEGPPVVSSLAKNLSSINLNDSLSISLKKVAPEFVPRCSPSVVAFPSTSPLTVTAHNASPTPTVPTYQEYVGGTTYFYAAPASQQTENNLSSSPIVGEEEPTPAILAAPSQSSMNIFSGSVGHGKTSLSQMNSSPASTNSSSLSSTTAGVSASDSSYFISNQLRAEIQHKNNLTLLQPDSSDLYPDLPVEVDNYHELVPLEPLPTTLKPHLIPYSTSTYKATHVKTGVRYCLRRVHGYRLPNSKCMVLVDMWKKLSHSNIVQLREVFTTKAFGDQSIVFVYDYHPDSETLLSRHFSQSDGLNGYSDSFSSNPNAPRPYSHSKNSLLRQQATNGMLPETTIWSYIIQLTGAMAVVHAAGLAARCIDPSKILHTGRLRLRISTPAILDVVTFDGTMSNPLSLIPHYQQEDLTALGKLVLALACRSLIAVQRDNLQTSLELMSRTYSSDLRNLVIYLLSNKSVRSVVELMPMIGARYYSQLDTVQYHNDILHSELAKEMENGRLLRLIVKLSSINERPELNMDPAWAETGDRYMLKLFRDHVFHQVTQDGRPFLDMAHVVHCLNKLDAGAHEKVCLMSRDEQSVLVVSYAELKHCLEQSFNEIVSAANAPKHP